MGVTKPWGFLSHLGATVRKLEKSYGFQTDVKWGTVFSIFGYHALAVWWCYHHAFPAKWQTLAFVILTATILGSVVDIYQPHNKFMALKMAYLMYVVSGAGITAGVHRYWSHHSYKATRPLQYILLIMFATCGQTSVLRFVRNHRVHHKACDTCADPHNASRGMFYSHIGWIMMMKNEKTLRIGRQIDVTDITGDPLLMWYERNLAWVNLMMCFILPTWFNKWAWGERLACAVAWQCFIRFLVVLHAGLSVNSFAHKYGHRPFDKTIKPAENFLISVVTLGEGFHNYHHAFPFDYKAADVLFTVNSASLLIKLWEKMGLAYSLKEATPEMIADMKARVGDGFRLKEAYDNE